MSENANSNGNSSENSILLKEGFMVKRGHVRHNWKTRWFKLSDTSLRYYKRQKDKVPQGRISLRNAKLSVYHSDHKSDKDREFVMLVETSEGVQYPIQAPSNEEMNIWMDSIRDVIEHMQLENEAYSPRIIGHENEDELPATLSPEVLGTYIDAYGGIKRESRIVDGVRHLDGFSGICLRVWMEHKMGIHGAEAEIALSRLQRVGLLELVDGDAGGGPFSKSKYYVLIGDEDSLEAMVSGKKLNGLTATSRASSCSSDGNSQSDDSVFSSTDLIVATSSPSAVLPSDLPPGEIVKRGILFKRGHVVPSWRARCFVLQRFPATLTYFDPAKKNAKVINALSLHGATVFSVEKKAAQAALRMRHPPDHLFCVKLSSGTLYIIKASSAEEREDWVNAIKIMCRKIRGGVSSSTGS